MSLDQLLFFVLLLAIPLLQRLVTAVRARRDASPHGGADAATAERMAEGQSVESAAHRPAAFQGAEIPALVFPPAPEGLGGSAGREAVVPPIPGGAPAGRRGRGQDLPATAPGAAPKLRSKRPRAIPNVIGTSTRRRVAFSGEDVRIALVRMAILGPCRALQPRDPSPAA